MTPANSTAHRAIDRHVAQSRMEFLVENLPVSIFAVVIGILVLDAVFFDLVDRTTLIGWNIAAFAVAGFRYWVYRRIQSRLHDASTLPADERLILLSATATGIIWGTASILFSLQGDLFDWVFLAFFMVGYATGAAFSTSALLPACAGYFFPTLVPLTIWFFFQDDPRAPWMGLLLSVHILAAWNMAKNAHRFSIDKAESRMKLQLAEQQTQLNREKVRALQDMAGGVAHDLNNTLAGIVGNLYLLKRKGDLSEETKQYTDAIEQGLESATKIGHQMLHYSRASMLQSQPIDLPALINELIEYFDTIGATISLQVEDDLPTIQGDPEAVRLMIRGVIINAHESYQDDQNENRNIAVSLRRETLCAREMVAITITDQGMGIPEEDLDRVFDPFFSTKFVGRGLGLSVAYGTVKRMQGDIEIASEVGIGTTVTLHLPIAPS